LHHCVSIFENYDSGKRSLEAQLLKDMRVHHIEFLCRDLKLQILKFCNSFGFSIYGRWKDGLYGGKGKIVLKREPIYVVMHEDSDAVCDYVENIALEVENIAEICNNMPSEYIAAEVTTLSGEGCGHFFKSNDNNSYDMKDLPRVEAALLRSPIGNLHHTLINKSNYSGPFLPSFSATDSAIDKYRTRVTSKNREMENENGLFMDGSNLLSLDHITFAVNTGTSFDLMEWYSKYLLMSRCKVNDKEESDGFKVETLNGSGEKLGLKLTAMQYHFCSEQSLKLLPHDLSDSEDVKVVFGESLLGQGPNQIDTFIKENGGPGVQHIGLLSKNIFNSVKEWSSNDVAFIKPPQHYYHEIDDKLHQINESGLKQLLEHYGVLLDTEESDEKIESLKYLLQVFTKPVFCKETFFFELIQRHGATGFGAGNISALWRAVDAYLREQHRFK